MRIGVDIRCLMEKQYSGVSEYTLNLLNSLFKIDSQNQYFLFYNSGKPIKIPEFNYSNVKIKKFSYPNKFFNFGLKFLKQPKLDKFLGDLDLFFLPNWHFFVASDNCQIVLTIHDIAFWRYPRFFSPKSHLWHHLVNPKRLCQKVDSVIAVSENTKNDLIEIFKIPKNKIKVIYSGINKEFKPLTDLEKLDRIKQKYNLPSNFILFLGTLEPRKNIESLIEAYNLVNTDKYLVIAGGKSWGWQNIYQTAQRSKKAEKIKFIGYVDRQDKPALYNLAKIFIYPSIYEGFGFPPLEAMACGTPVITSFTASLPEVVGEAGIMVDPYNINDLAKVIDIVTSDRETRDKLVKRGLERAKRFSWERCAKETLEVFENVKIKNQSEK